MDVFKLLKQDHRTAKKLFKEIEGAESAPKRREKAFQQLERELTIHTQLEEQLVYPRFREEEKLKESTLEAYEEHHVAKQLLQELSETSMEDERWDAKLSVLKEMIEHHVEEEEKEIFPKAEKALGKEEAKELGKRVETAKKELMRGKKSSLAGQSAGAGEEARV